MVLLKKSMSGGQVRIANQEELKKGLDLIRQRTESQHAEFSEGQGVLGRSDQLRQTVGDRTPLSRENDSDGTN